MPLTATQIRQAEAMQRRGLLLREIAARLDTTFTAVALALYGDNTGSAAAVPDRVLYQDSGVEADRDRGAMHEAGRGEESQPRLPSGRAENKPDAPAVTAGENSQAKVFTGNGATAQAPTERPANSVAGETSRPDAGWSASASSELMDVTGGESAATYSPDHVADAGNMVEAHAIGPDGNAGGMVLPVRDFALAGTASDAAPDSIAEEVPLNVTQRYRLEGHDRQCLHERRHCLTRISRFYWRGTRDQVRALKAAHPEWRNLREVPIT